MRLDAIPDTIPLSTAEKTRFAELEAAVETHLDAFMWVGEALSEIRSKRLYRIEYPTFEAYVQQRWGLGRWRANELIRSYACAQLLLESSGAPDSATPLPRHIPEGAVRPISQLAGEELQSQVWRLVSTVSQSSGISLRSAAHQISYMVKEAVCETNGSEEKKTTAPKAIFIRSVQVLARSGFDVELALLQVKTSEGATAVYQACQLVSARCALVQAHLENHYPDLQCHPAPADA